MGFTVSSYHPKNFQEHTIENVYVCFDMNNPFSIKRDNQNNSIFTLYANFSIYKSQQDRENNVSPIEKFSLSVKNVNMSQSLSTTSYTQAKSFFPGVTITDV